MDFLRQTYSVVFIVCIIVQLIPTSKQNSVSFKVEEESQPRTTIGNIRTSVPVDMGSDLNFRILESQMMQYFKIGEDGSIQVNSEIDLETLCVKRKLCCGTTKCSLDFKVLVSNPKGNMKPIDVKIDIVDVNDNKPTFDEPSQRVRVQEGANINTRIGLRKASDGDKSPVNQVTRYTFTENTDTFTLVDDRRGIALLVKKKLDYEKKMEYKGKLEACDILTCVSQEIVVEVLDENDNSPKFVQKVYTAKVKENFLIDDVIVTLKANDKDSGQYGRVQYLFQSDGDQDLENTFEVRLDTGEIRLRQKLSAKSRSKYKFQVAAIDVSNPDSGKDTAEVNIDVEDINDFAPLISIMLPAEPISIEENTDAKIVATISVTDEDLGDNSVVDCALSKHSERYFELSTASAGLYTLKTTKQFNYESRSSVTATLICKDRGNPSQTSTRPILINIIDKNEFTPTFSPTIYRKSVKENSSPGQRVLKLQASDKDGSANLTYSLDGEGRQYFSVDQTTGWIHTGNTHLDREQVDKVTFTAIVRDGDKDTRSATASLEITVEDENDNAPVFTSLSRFDLLENQPMFTQLNGQLTASDADKDTNSEVTFDIMKAWAIGSGGQQQVENYFRVKDDGIIETLRPIDRETFSEFIIQVVAKDRASADSQLSTTANITVVVGDENDNTPEWRYPRDRDNTINITSSMEAGELVVTVRARDKDAGANGRVFFDLLSETATGSSGSSSPEMRMFLLNETTGDVLVANSLVPGQYRLQMRAADYGKPEHQSMTWLIVNVYGADVAQLNFTIIVIMVTVTAVISIFLIVAIICVRRRPPRYGSPAESDLTKDHLPNWAYQLEDQPGGPVGDAASAIFMPGCPEDNTVAMHTFGGNRCCGDMRLHYELDGDSADSGRGGSEDDAGLHSHLPGGDSSKGWPFSPVQFHNRPPSRVSLRGRVSSPVPSNTTAGGCQCYILPEDGVIQSGQSPFPNYNRPMVPTGMYNASGSQFGSGHLNPPPAYDTHSLPRVARRAYIQPVGGGAGIRENPDGISTNFHMQGMTMGRLNMADISGYPNRIIRDPEVSVYPAVASTFRDVGDIGEDEDAEVAEASGDSTTGAAAKPLLSGNGESMQRSSPAPLPAPPQPTTSTFAPVTTSSLSSQRNDAVDMNNGMPATTFSKYTTNNDSGFNPNRFTRT